MDGDLRSLALRLQSLFGQFAESHNRTVAWVQRQRSLSASQWVVLLVFGWVGCRWRNFADLAHLAGVTPQALQQRLDDKAVQLFRAVWQEALQFVFQAHRPLIPLLSRFRGIVVDDSTQVPLPASLAELYPACGGLDGQRGKAGWKWLIRYDLLTGRLYPFDLVSGKTSDRTTSVSDLEAGVLYLADLGYFGLERLRQILQVGAHYITRLPAHVEVCSEHRTDSALVGQWLSRQTGDLLDVRICLGKANPLTTRLVAVRVPAEVAAQRRRKLQAKSRKRGRSVSDNQRALCDWWVGVTDLPASAYSDEEIRVLYRLRWQVELLFKHWKQAGGLGEIHGRTAASVQVEYLAKLLGVMVTHWQELLGGGPLEGKNRRAVHRWVCGACVKIAAVLGGPNELENLVKILEELAAALKKQRRRPCRKKAPSSRQRVYRKQLVA